MATITVNEDELKEIVEDLVENDLVALLANKKKIREIFEDLALGQMMEEAKDSPVIDKNSFMKKLKKRITGK